MTMVQGTNSYPGGMWWQDGVKSEDRANAVRNAYDALAIDDADRRAFMTHYLRMYGVRDFYDLDEGMDVIHAISLLNNRGQLTYNLVKSVVDTGTSFIGKMKPKAAYLTSGGTWSDHTRARKLEKYVEGCFDATKLHTKGRMVFRDGMLIGTGAAKFFSEKTKHGHRVGCERVFPWEILVDRYDGRYQNPMTMYHVKRVDISQAKAKWDLTDSDIQKSVKRQARADGRTMTEQLELVEAWRKPSFPGAGDGRHVLSAGSKAIVDEPWEEDWFPIVLYHWTQPPVGMWGTGAAHDINGIQIELNRMLDIIQRSYQLYSKPYVMLHRGAKVVKSYVTDEIGRILEWEGNIKPEVITHQPIHPQMFQHVGNLKTDGYELSGVSQMQATNQKPADLESGEALRQWNDREQGRTADPSLALEEWYMDCAKVIVGTSRRMAEAGISPTTMAIFRRRSSRWVEPIDWKDVALDEESYLMQVYPVSSLPSTPAGRTATVEQWIGAGLVTQDEARYLLDFPDLEAHTSLRLSPLETILDAIEQIVDKGKFQTPEPFQGLEMTLEYVQLAYLRAKLDKVPGDRLEMLRIYMVQAEALIQKESGNMPATVGDAMAASASQAAEGMQGAMAQPGMVDPAMAGVVAPAPQMGPGMDPGMMGTLALPPGA